MTDKEKTIEIGKYALECCCDVIFTVIGFWTGFMLTSWFACEYLL